MNDDELLRYSRHILLPEIDVAGQEALTNSHVLIVGMGGLGSPIALYLAAAGIGTITICDDDIVDITNLQRQIAHHSQDVGTPKVESAANKIKEINPNIVVQTRQSRLAADELDGLVADANLVVDATDNFAIRVAINRASIKHKTPAIFGAAVRLEGQIFVSDPRSPDHPCYECLHQNIDDGAMNCAENGVAGPVVGIVGTMQAMEAIRIICSIGRSTAGVFQNFDARDMKWQQFKVQKRIDCAACAR